MKYLLIALPLFIMSCKSETQAEITERQIKESAMKFIKTAFPDDGNFKIDSLRIESIDSISMKEAMTHKVSHYNMIYTAKDDLWKALNDVVILGKGLYDADVQRINKEKADAVKAEKDLIVKNYLALNEKMKIMDSVTFEYYRSEITFFWMEKGSLKSSKAPLIMTKNFAVIRPEDL